MSDSRDIEDDIVAAIRRIIRAIDLQSRRLFERHALTGPQLATLREAARQPGCTTGSLARSAHLSQPTVTGILNRLERCGLVRRERSSGDRRSVQIHVSEQGAELLAEAPSLLQERFRSELAGIEAWERHALLTGV